MAKRGVLDRLWRLRELEEEQSRLVLEAQVQHRNRIAQGLEAATAAGEKSRRLFAARLGDLDTAARTGALLEVEQARRRQEAIRPRLEKADSEVEVRREEFLLRRTGRRQVESLLDGQKEAAREETARRAQQMLDDWFGRNGVRSRAAERKAEAQSTDTSARPAPPALP